MKLNNECKLLLATATHAKSEFIDAVLLRSWKEMYLSTRLDIEGTSQQFATAGHLALILSGLSVHQNIASPAHIDPKNRQPTGPLAGYSSILLLSCTLHIACSCSHLDAIHFSPCWTRSPECKEARSSCPFSAFDLHCADLMSRCNMGCYSSTMSLTGSQASQ